MKASKFFWLKSKFARVLAEKTEEPVQVEQVREEKPLEEEEPKPAPEPKKTQNSKKKA